MDRQRSHPDDQAHRLEIKGLVQAMRQATGRRGRRDPFDRPGQDDIRITSILEWAQRSGFQINFSFGTLEIPEEFREGTEGETPDEWIKRSRKALRAVRVEIGHSMVDMDRILDQQYGVYRQWEIRTGPYQVTAMQRIIRALGGEFRLVFTHKTNPGLVKRLTSNKK